MTTKNIKVFVAFTALAAVAITVRVVDGAPRPTFVVDSGVGYRDGYCFADSVLWQARIGPDTIACSRADMYGTSFVSPPGAEYQFITGKRQ